MDISLLEVQQIVIILTGVTTVVCRLIKLYCDLVKVK